jgi:hypothetical protein
MNLFDTKRIVLLATLAATTMIVSVCFARICVPSTAHRLSGNSSTEIPRIIFSRVIPHNEKYAFTSKAFREFVCESYSSTKKDNPGELFNMLNRAYLNGLTRKQVRHASLAALLRSRRTELSGISDPIRRTNREVALSMWVHSFVKRSIPRFSLDRGFEFANSVRYGERQCFLQSVLIAGLLQEAGMKAGVVMVNRNERGQESNNGHAVTLVKLADGMDVIVDASEPYPFVRHQGLFVKTSSYTYVVPRFHTDSAKIEAYIRSSDGRHFAATQVNSLDIPFLHSQFYYYRGERQVGGVIATHHTPSALKATEQNLRRSVAFCPQNPLAVYMLGRTYLAEGKTGQAGITLIKALHLYQQFGWVPDGPKQYMAKAITRIIHENRRADAPEGRKIKV